MKKLSGFLFFVFFILSNLFSQVNKDGLPFITKYTDKDYGDAGQIWAITQDNRGIMYFGCNYGLKTYDGKNWKSYNIPQSTILRSLATDDKGNVYYGAESDFGVITADNNGKIKFHSLYLDKFSGDSVDFGAVWKTLIADDKIYFQSFNKLFYLNLPLKYNNDTLINEIKIIKPGSMFHLSFSVDNTFYIREWEKGLCKIVNNKLELIPGGEKFAYLRVYVMLPFDKNRILIGTREEGFFLYDKTKKKNTISPFKIDNNDAIINSAIYNGVKLPNGNFVIGTFADGLFVFDKSGKIINHFNQNTGFPNEFVTTLYFNKNNLDTRLWFVYRDNGIYSADIAGNFTYWDETFGLSGIVNDMINYNGKYYFAANNSLYYLDQNKKFSSPGFKKIYSENQDIWKFLKFNISHSNKSKLLMVSFSGLYEIQDTGVYKIANINNAKALYQSSVDPEKLYVGSDAGLSLFLFKNNKWSQPVNNKYFNYSVVSILENNDSIIVGSDKGVYLLNNIIDKNYVRLDSSSGLPLVGKDYFLHKINNKIIIANGAGLYEIIDTSHVVPFDYFGKQFCNKKTGVYQYAEDKNSYWMSVYDNNQENTHHRIIKFNKKTLFKDSLFSKNLPHKSTFCIYPDGNYVWIGNEGGLFKFNKKIQKNYKSPYNTIITKVITSDDSVLFAGNFVNKSNKTISFSLKQPEDEIPVLKFKHNKLIFEWAAPFFEKEKETEYSFRLIGESDKWSKWSKKTDTRYTNLYEGDYTFEVKARNIYNTESSVAQYSFSILPPWYRTIWAYVLFFIAGILLILLIIKLYTKKLKRENEKLEQIVKERTAEIRQQNEEITAQRDEIQAQKEVVEKAKEKIEIQQKSIMDSIHYASRIQEAVLPPDEYLDKILGEHFVLFRPRDIVSGDFYWATERENTTIIVAADCTGHGVPGAFMSMLGMSFLNEIVNKDGILQANIILNRLRENVKKSLRQTGKENEAKDGMDIAVCVIDKTEMKLQFAGAYNPLLIIRDDEISRIKADRMPIGIYLREKESFTNNIIDIKKGDLLYIFSDGYVDQFGGENDSKIRSAKFKEILLENHKKSLAEQKAALVKFLEEWMNHTDKTGKKYKQVDDILVIGIEI